MATLVDSVLLPAPAELVADVLVIGAGPAGLAAAHAMTAGGRRVKVLERCENVASTWRRHRASLRLHTTRRHSGLPGTAIPKAHGQHPRSSDMVRYFDDYARKHGFDISFGVEVTRIARTSGHVQRWMVSTASGDFYLAHTVIVATGHNRQPFVPDIPGSSAYERPMLHVTEYLGGSQFSGKDVLIMGSGNAAVEAAAELVGAGASRVRMAVRTTPHIRRDVCGIPAQDIAIMMSHLPVRWADRAAALLARATIPSTARMGLPRPTPDLFTRAARDRSVPVHDTGIIHLIATRAVEPTTSVVTLEGDGVRLRDGSLIHPDIVIVATGYHPGLDSLLNGMNILDARGNPPHHADEVIPPGLHFVGFASSGAGALRDISAEAARVAQEEGAAYTAPVDNREGFEPASSPRNCCICRICREVEVARDSGATARARLSR